MVNPNMLNLIASAIENGVQDMHSLEAAYRYISQGVEESSVKKPILTTSDGHSSRFSHPGLSFLLIVMDWTCFLGLQDLPSCWIKSISTVNIKNLKRNYSQMR